MNAPLDVLSEAIQRQIGDRLVENAVFLTFRFDPGFFEQEVLPVLVDVPSQVPSVKLLMLEDALRDQIRHIAVYYDRNGIDAGSASAKLDVHRVAITQNAFFHPKNVLLLVRPEGTDTEPEPPQSLIVATMSANLTRAGWWENVEVCHIEEVTSGEKTSLRDDLLDLIRRIKRAARAEDRHEALDEIADFLRAETSAYSHATDAGVLRSRFYSGGTSVPDFLDSVLAGNTDGWNLEVISPYFDATTAGPLRELIERFAPREVRVLLPRDATGVALCDESYWQTVLDLGAETGISVNWGSFSRSLLSAGKGDRAVHRNVHAKVYRFFRRRPDDEIAFIGSINLTAAGHSRGGNFETGILVHCQTKRPSWWLEPDEDRPIGFERDSEGEQTASARLGVRYDWSTSRGAVFWDSPSMSPSIRVAANGPVLFVLESILPGEWVELSDEQSAALRARLEQSSFLAVSAGEEAEATVLIQEIAMERKPSLIVTLPIEDILKYWALLTPEQKAAFLDARVREVAENGLTVPTTPMGQIASIFSTFAGIFQAFGAVKQRLDTAFEEGRLRQVEYYLFGRRYDSLHALLDRAREESSAGDPVKLYVVALCARQLVDAVRKEHKAFAKDYRKDFEELRDSIKLALQVRKDIDLPRDERREFFEWFEKWFLKTAPPLPVAAE